MSFWHRMGLGTLLTTVAGLVLLVALPQIVSLYNILQITIFVVMAILALSLALVWGLGGILCFGQAAFFGLGGYAYAIAVENMGDSTAPMLISIVLPALFAAGLGYFMFFGRLSELYVGVVTLCVTLILFNFINSTSDPAYAIGQAELNGFNGMSSVPTVNWPGAVDAQLGPVQIFYLCMGSLIVVYVLCKAIVASTFGRIVRAVKESEDRAELMGYNTALIKLLIFSVGAGIAGYAGALFTNWNAFISPNVFSLATTAQTIIWIIVGGASTFIGPVIGAFGLQYLSTRLGAGSYLDVNLVLGLILMLFVVFAPQGLVPTIGMLGRATWTRLARRAPTPPVVQQARPTPRKQADRI